MQKKRDYSGWTKEELIKRVEALEKRKKYGLVWDEESTQEEFEEESRGKLPVLVEDKSKAIHTDDAQPTHILIEGDNYHALSVLNYTHEGKIDVIYIDPPYNTGNNDFIYNDNLVDQDDGYRHSKWLSFISKRLKLCEKLLSKKGLIIISIDDNEVAQLKILCDEIFNLNNFIALIPTIINLKGNNDQFGFSGTHEYNLIYSKNKVFAQINEYNLNEDELEKWDEDEKGLFKKGANLKATGVNAPREKRPNLYYPIFISEDDKVYVTDDNKIPQERKMMGDKELLPITSGNEMSWRWEKNRIKNNIDEIIVIKNNQDVSLYKKQRPNLGDIPTRKPKSFFYKPSYSSGNGTQLLKEIFGKKIFNNPKPLELIRDIIHLCSNRESVILDYFAGSGTTGHAMLELNEEDRGNRQFILCTNNENKIAEEVCYPRVSKVIQGYTNSKGKEIDGLGGNLKYFKTNFVPGESTDANKKLITERSVEMLCLKEDTFEAVEEKDGWQIFRNRGKYTGILFEPEEIAAFRRRIEALDKPVSVYIFSLSDETYAEEFAGLEGKITLCAVPESILKVYRRIYQ